MNRLALCVALAAALAGCGSDSQDTSPPKTSVATATAGDLTVELLTDDALETGMTPIYLRVKTAGGQVLTDASVTFQPMMTMAGGMTHGAPVIGTPTAGDDGLYRCAVVFQMASGAMGSWSAKVSVSRPGAAPVDATFPSLAVVDTGCAKTFSYTDPDTSAVTKYVASMDLKEKARVGLNPIVFTLHRAQGMSFVPVDDALLTLDPQMPSMGHGSPGSVNPTLRSSAVYEGSVSFSMAGDWQTTVSVSRSGVTLGAPKFATSF
jgi:YtkA-like